MATVLDRQAPGMGRQDASAIMGTPKALASVDIPSLQGKVSEESGRSASISPPPTGWSRIMAGTTSSSRTSRPASPAPSIISCSTRTI
jgi:hypothetical protein